MMQRITIKSHRRWQRRAITVSTLTSKFTKMINFFFLKSNFVVIFSVSLSLRRQRNQRNRKTTKTNLRKKYWISNRFLFLFCVNYFQKSKKRDDTNNEKVFFKTLFIIFVINFLFIRRKTTIIITTKMTMKMIQRFLFFVIN